MVDVPLGKYFKKIKQTQDTHVFIMYHITHLYKKMYLGEEPMKRVPLCCIMLHLNLTPTSDPPLKHQVHTKQETNNLARMPNTQT